MAVKKSSAAKVMKQQEEKLDPDVLSRLEAASQGIGIGTYQRSTFGAFIRVTGLRMEVVINPDQS